MNKKRRFVVFLIVTVLGILAINNFLFPIYLYNCDCEPSWDEYNYICEENCGPGECAINTGYNGQCEDVGCRVDIYYYCLDLGTQGRTTYLIWFCLDCVEW
jgi:hypothetical protein